MATALPSVLEGVWISRVHVAAPHHWSGQDFSFFGGNLALRSLAIHENVSGERLAEAISTGSQQMLGLNPFLR